MKIFTLKLSLLLGFLLTATLGMAQTSITTVGIIGSATANGWNSSTAMTQVTANGHDWTITLPLTVGEAKFRANDAWTVNWGASAFPSGTGVQDGANIPVATAGRYTVRFNDVTGAYSFSVVTATKASNATLLSLSLAPNPAQNMMSVTYDLPTAAPAAITVQNLMGQTVREFAPVYQGVGQQSQQLSLQGLAAGIYLVQLKTGTLAQTARLLVE